MLYKLINALIFCGRYRYNRYAKHSLYGVDINGAMISCHLIHHIQSHYHRNVHLKKLHGKIQISLYIRGINYVDDCLWVFIEHKVTRYNLLTAVWRHRIYSG